MEGKDSGKKIGVKTQEGMEAGAMEEGEWRKENGERRMEDVPWTSKGMQKF